MKRTFILGCALFAAIFGGAADAAPMHPILRESRFADTCVIDEQRDAKYSDLLEVSVKVSVSGGAGSGTICHYDPSTGWAHVVSCGHLWTGDKPYSKSAKVPARVTVWYKSGSRLEEPRTYDAEALFWSNARGYDVSLIRFRPDWNARYSPIAPHFFAKKGDVLNSMGCDGGGEVARYEVVLASFSPPDITTTKNSPRPGRSGGGLIDDRGMVVGVCWGTSDISSGDGTGFFTPLDSIREVFIKNQHGWLLEVAADARMIPVIDYDDPSSRHGVHFIPLPSAFHQREDRSPSQTGFRW